MKHRNPLTPDDPRHGTANGYINYRCRCDPCLDAGHAYHSAFKLRRKKRGLEPEDPRHGTQTGYGNYGCRCVPCCDAYADARVTWKANAWKEGRMG